MTYDTKAAGYQIITTVLDTQWYSKVAFVYTKLKVIVVWMHFQQI